MIQGPTFWLIIAFAIFLFLTWRKIQKAASTGVESYIQKVRAKVEEAEQFKQRAEDLLREADRQYMKALSDAEMMISQAKDEALLMKQKAEADAKLLVEKFEKMAADREKQLQVSTLDSLKQMTADLSLKALERVLLEQLTEADQKKMVNESIALLAAKMN